MENEQEVIYKLQMFEQQIQHLQQQIKAIDQGIEDLNLINNGLDELIGAKDKEVLSPIGKGIFAKTKLISEELIVDVGSKNFVTKSIPDTKNIIKEQLEKLEEIRMELQANVERGSLEFQRLLMDAQAQFQKQHECCGGHGDECSCAKGEECEDKENCECENKKE